MRVAVTLLLAALLAGCSSAPSRPSTSDALATASRNLASAAEKAQEQARPTGPDRDAYGLSPTDAAATLAGGRTVATESAGGREVFASRRFRVETTGGSGGYRSVPVPYFSVRCLDDEFGHEFRTSQAAVDYAGAHCGGSGHWRPADQK